MAWLLNRGKKGAKIPKTMEKIVLIHLDIEVTTSYLELKWDMETKMLIPNGGKSAYEELA